MHLLLLLFLSSVFPTLKTPQEPIEPPKATIQGIVSRAGAGTPLRGARVALVKIDGRDNGAETTLSTVVTDDASRFAFIGIAAGDYKISAVRDGFASRTVRVAVGTAQSVTVNLTMSPGAVITGRVVDERGEPVGRATIQAHSYQYVNGNRTLGATQAAVSTEAFFTPISASTDDRGEYRLFWLAPGEYYVSATARRQIAASTANISALPVPERGLTDLMLARQLSESSAPIYYPGVADPDSASRISVGVGQEVRGIDITWRAIRLATIRGRKIVPSAPGDRPQPPGTVGAQWGGGTIMLTRVTDERVPVSISGGSGDQFELRAVPSGSYFINVLETRTDSTFFGRARVEVRDVDLNEVAVTLQPVGTLQGRVSLEPGAPPSFRITQVGIDVDSDLGMGSATVRVAENGRFTVRRVVPPLRLEVTGLPPGSSVVSANLGMTDVLAGSFVPPNDQNSPEIRIGFSSGRVSGSVTDEKGAPYSGALVTLIPDEPKRSRSDLYFTTVTDTAGHFSFGDVPSGNYRAFAWEDIPPGAHQSSEFLRPFEARGTPVRVENSGAVDVRLRVIPAITN